MRIEELVELKQQLQVEKGKSRRIWRTNCEQDVIMTSLEKEIATLKNQIKEVKILGSPETKASQFSKEKYQRQNMCSLFLTPYPWKLL